MQKNRVDVKSKTKYYLVYKITNTCNNCYYIGAHETYTVDDNYYGSGLFIKWAIAKYGKQKFVKKILHFCKSREEMFLAEKSEIEKAGYYPENLLSYNLKEGGKGGWIQTKESPFKGKHFTETQRERLKTSTIQAMWTPEVRRRYLEANSRVDRSGKNNTMYGDTRIFITNLKLRIRKRIDKSELQKYVNDGWINGRCESKLKNFTYEGAHKGDTIVVLMGADKIPENYYRGKDGKFVKDTKIDQQYVHPTKRYSRQSRKK